MIKSYTYLEVYNKSYKLAMDIFHTSKQFPKREKYSLTSQLVRSSRSISANITEGWAKREYENLFKQHLIHALGSNAETENWINFALDCENITEKTFKTYQEELSSIGKSLRNCIKTGPPARFYGTMPETGYLFHPVSNI